MKIVFAVLPHLIIAVALLGLVFQIFRFGETRRAPGMATVIDWLWRIARWLYGGYFIYTAVMIGRTLWIGGKGVQQPTPEAKAFYEALHATGFLYPLMGITFGVGGLALILHRTAPLGLVLLAPSVGVIFLFHLMLTGSVVWGTEWALGLVLLAWHYRSAYTALWNYTSPGVAMGANG
jgi:hypothetical protein